ncbi:hypothetical protein QBC47DRAFT_122285 [Echria macrotheca]|uniref:DUF8035 domain-containing protein n=1 Tax=Echria macrotheca TaxID=438768 RepID=A0AAJ0B238_9PEZI|nr:hypothetical protein QBC47DRAFT_122285 [Echria macrotheca]
MSSRSRVDFEERDYYREASRGRNERDDVEVRIRERSRDRVPAFLREERRPEQGPLVLRQREVEERVVRRRSPSPVRLRETRIVRARSVSPMPPPRRTEEDIRYRAVERVREPSRGPDLERLRARIVERDISSSPSPPPVDRVRARIIERGRSPSPIRERSRIRIIEKEKEKVRERSPSPQPKVIKGPVIEREVITHYRDIDHGVVQVRPPSPPPVRRKEKERDTEIDIYTSRKETDIDIRHSHSRGRSPSRSRSRERVSRPHHSRAWDDELILHSDTKHLHVDVEARRSHSRTRRAHSEAPIYRDEYDEGREITSRIDARGKMGEARNGITKDWTIVDVPPGTERVRMDGAGGGSAEVTWQKYSGVRRSRFIPDRDEKSIVSSSTSISERETDSRRGSRLSVQIIDKSDKEVDGRRPSNQRSEMWTEITKDLVIREAIEELGYEYEETEYFFYVMTYLRYEDVLQLVQLSDAVRRARKDRITEIQWERGYQDDWDREYRVHAHSHHHHDGGRRRRYEDDRYSEISYERDTRRYHS